MPPENSDEIARHVRIITKTGTEIAKTKFSYKVKNTADQKYWTRRVNEHEKYFEKSATYYNHAYQLMKIISAKDSDAFLLAVSKFHQLKTKQMEILTKIANNPTIMKAKDKQQSEWSKNTRDDIIENSSKCLEHEKYMSGLFRKFTEIHQKDISRD